MFYCWSTTKYTCFIFWTVSNFLKVSGCGWCCMVFGICDNVKMTDIYKKIDSFFFDRPETVIKLFPSIFETKEKELVDFFWNLSHDKICDYLKNRKNVSEANELHDNYIRDFFILRFDYLVKNLGKDLDLPEFKEFFNDFNLVKEETKKVSLDAIVDNLIAQNEVEVYKKILFKCDPKIVDGSIAGFLFVKADEKFGLAIDFLKSKNNSLDLSGVGINNIFRHLPEDRLVVFFNELRNKIPSFDSVVLGGLKDGFQNKRMYIVDYFWNDFVEINKRTEDLSLEDKHANNALLLNVVSVGKNIKDLLGCKMFNLMASKDFSVNKSVSLIRDANEFVANLNHAKDFYYKTVLPVDARVNLLEHSLYSLNLEAYKELSSFYGELSSEKFDKIRETLKKYPHPEIISQNGWENLTIKLDVIALNNRIPESPTKKSVLKV